MAKVGKRLYIPVHFVAQ